MLGRWVGIFSLCLAFGTAAILLGWVPLVDRTLGPGEAVEMGFGIGGATVETLDSIRIRVELSGKIPIGGYVFWIEFTRPENIEILYAQRYGGIEISDIIPVEGELSVELDFSMGTEGGSIGSMNLYPHGVEFYDFYTKELSASNPSFRIEPNVWHRLTFHHYDNLATVYVDGRPACSLRLPLVTKELWVNDGFILISDKILVDNLVISRMVPPTSIAVFPALQNPVLKKNEWSVACNYTMRTGGTLADPSHEIYLGRKQAESVLTNRKVRFTNHSPRDLTVNRFEVIVSYGGEETASEWKGRFWFEGLLLILVSVLIVGLLVFIPWVIIRRREYEWSS